MKRLWICLCLTGAMTAGLAMMAYGHGMGGDHSNLAVGPDGTIYVITHGEMMGPGMGPRGMDQSRLLAIDPTGRTRWSFEIEGYRAMSVPVLATDGTIYFTATEFGFDDHDPQFGYSGEEIPKGRLFAVKNGQLKWAYDFDGMMASKPILAPDGTIYFTTSFLDDVDGMGPGPDMPMDGVFLALRDGQTEAVLAWKIEFDAPMISEPVIGTDVPGYPWVVYVSVMGMGHGHDHSQRGRMDEVNLYEIHPDGSSRRIL